MLALFPGLIPALFDILGFVGFVHVTASSCSVCERRHYTHFNARKRITGESASILQTRKKNRKKPRVF
jgi:hypothetical protein